MHTDPLYELRLSVPCAFTFSDNLPEWIWSKISQPMKWHSYSRNKYMWLHYIILSYLILYYYILWYYNILYYIIAYYVMLCYVILYYIFMWFVLFKDNLFRKFSGIVADFQVAKYHCHHKEYAMWRNQVPSPPNANNFVNDFLQSSRMHSLKASLRTRFTA